MGVIRSTKGECFMKRRLKIDKVTRVTNVVLGIFYYLFFALFSFIGGMVSEATIDATNPVYIRLYIIASWVTMGNALFSLVAIPLAVHIKKKGHSLLSLLVSLGPLMVFAVFCLLLCIADRFPSVL